MLHVASVVRVGDGDYGKSVQGAVWRLGIKLIVWYWKILIREVRGAWLANRILYEHGEDVSFFGKNQGYSERIFLLGLIRMHAPRKVLSEASSLCGQACIFPHAWRSKAD